MNRSCSVVKKLVMHDANNHNHDYKNLNSIKYLVVLREIFVLIDCKTPNFPRFAFI